MKGIILSVVISVAIIGGALYLSSRGGEGETNNIRVENGKQIIKINAKGGYFPRKTKAAADIPTVIRMNTKGTFDCSSSLVIPKLGYRKILPAEGNTDIELQAQKAGTKIQGLCGMGMYNFEISFQ